MTASTSSSISNLVIHTHDVARSLKPSTDGELAHAIHQTFHFALDGHPDDWSLDFHTQTNASLCDDPPPPPPASPPSVSEQPLRIRPGFFPNDSKDRPFVSYLWDSTNHTLSLPHPLSISQSPCGSSSSSSSSSRIGHEVTAKFFYLSSSSEQEGKMNQFPSEWITDALYKLKESTGLETIDTFIVSFPTLDLVSDKSLTSTTISSIANVWQSISKLDQLQSLGLSDLSQSVLHQLLPFLDSEDSKLPKLITINVKSSGFDRDLSNYCHQHGMLLVAHNDRKDILPSRTIPSVLSEFNGKLPIPLSQSVKMSPKWVLKYTTLIKDRGVLTEKGYIIFATVEPQ